MVYVADEKRYEKMTYAYCGKSGLKLPAVSLGLWHNFGSTGNFETMKAMCRTAFDNGILIWPTITGRSMVVQKRISAAFWLQNSSPIEISW